MGTRGKFDDDSVCLTTGGASIRIGLKGRGGRGGTGGKSAEVTRPLLESLFIRMISSSRDFTLNKSFLVADE